MFFKEKCDAECCVGVDGTKKRYFCYFFSGVKGRGNNEERVTFIQTVTLSVVRYLQWEQVVVNIDCSFKFIQYFPIARKIFVDVIG